MDPYFVRGDVNIVKIVYVTIIDNTVCRKSLWVQLCWIAVTLIILKSEINPEAL